MGKEPKEKKPKAPSASKEPKAPKEPPIEEEIPDTVLILNSAGGVVRTYTREEHGDNFLALAESFAKKHGKRVQIPEKGVTAAEPD